MTPAKLRRLAEQRMPRPLQSPAVLLALSLAWALPVLLSLLPLLAVPQQLALKLAVQLAGLLPELLPADSGCV